MRIRKDDKHMFKTTFKNYKWGVVVTHYNNIEYIKLFNSKKEAQREIDSLLLLYEEDDVTLWNKKQCKESIREFQEKRENTNYIVFCYHPIQNHNRPQYWKEVV